MLSKKLFDHQGFGDVGEEPKITPEVEKKTKQYYNPPKPVKKKQVSIYLDSDVIEALNEYNKREGKGAKSNLINNFLIDMFELRKGE